MTSIKCKFNWNQQYHLVQISQSTKLAPKILYNKLQNEKNKKLGSKTTSQTNT